MLRGSGSPGKGVCMGPLAALAEYRGCLAAPAAKAEHNAGNSGCRLRCKAGRQLPYFSMSARLIAHIPLLAT